MMTKAALLILAALSLTACGATRQAEIDTAAADAAVVLNDCTAKRRAGKITWMGESDCADARTRSILVAANYPHMDLVDLFFANRRMIFEYADNGKLSAAEADYLLAETRANINAEFLRRSTAREQTVAAQAAATGALLQGVSSAFKPPPVPRTTICNAVGTAIYCN